ncbi:uncharacterized protein CcaverHIS019_0405420 [Cutaneotrichosporon cavernicola]|uniref:Thiamine-binding protein domain-containing protein n=1 Tax=Cutaneotrichosporon cavernicola TaxID=279322 RepID=A0AA48L4C5_9TREE|nr:uncharacterized protein CcaverHIS019_0405420 [Cutaneotrichosporon cavernicola]BEI91722.1 hypothetical protein CcaverHIS019_0405420 [Cutaneotrichosporon cavernicola]BEI99495.1 hypothetical protein CcaverHIS631_0405380 [Cutaneotrichosporon cavernicola]BEJ07273.1 hypothetical protein CcaverHIS641_0405420 [Cutaneotrichosporon cavernicola]
MSSQKPNDSLYAVADFCLIPMGLPTPSVGPQIAECQRILEKSGLEYRLHGYGTNVEGPWDKVMETDVRIGTRTDRVIAGGGNDKKKQRVEEILANKD